MIKSQLYDMKGKNQGEVKLSKDVFDAPGNESLMHTAVVQFLAGQRQGTASSKTKGEVRGGGKKPWRQKGTGRARAGSTRSPLWRGGGVIFGPKPRDYSFAIPKKVKRSSVRIALSDKLREGKLKILDSIDLKEHKTKLVAKMLKDLKMEGKTLIVEDDPSKSVVLASRNLKDVKLVRQDALNAYDIIAHDNLIITKKAVTKIEERLKK